MLNPYETTSYLSEYLLFHYGKPKDLCDWPQVPKGVFDFHRRIARDMVRRRGSRALDLGCAVGRLSFELSRHFDEVIGVDFSKNFVKAARSLAKTRSASFTVCQEGDIAVRRTIRLDPKFRPSRIRGMRFETGDAEKLRSSLGVFDVIVMANLICRLKNPARCLRQMKKMIRPGGQLVITTPCSWLEGYVPKKNRLARPGRTTLEALRKILAPHFKLAKRRDLPFLIREHRRKFQFIVAEASCWIRK